MELFDPKFVYCVWDDKLFGKKVFYSDCILKIKNKVNDNIGIITTVTNSSSLDRPFTDETGQDWAFVYYDPNYDCKIAYNEGKQIQYYDEHNNQWKDVINCPLWSDRARYRVKPEEKKFRPFNNTAELINHTGTKLIWLKDKFSPSEYLITEYSETYVQIGPINCRVNELLGRYTFVDRTPCGVEE